MGIRPQRHTKGPSQAKIGQFQVPLTINKQILGLQIAMNNPMTMTIAQSLTQMSHKLLNNRFIQTDRSTALREPIWQRLAASTVTNRQSVHIFLQIEVHEFHNEVEIVTFGIDDVVQANDAGILHFLEQGNFADGGAGNALVCIFEADLFQRDDSVRMIEFARFVDDAISA